MGLLLPLRLPLASSLAAAIVSVALGMRLGGEERYAEVGRGRRDKLGRQGREEGSGRFWLTLSALPWEGVILKSVLNAERWV